MAKIVAFYSNPTGTRLLRLQHEIKTIEESASWAGINFLDLHVKSNIRKDDLITTLMKHKPSIVHFSGHGNELGQIFFEDINGEIVDVTPDDLVNAFLPFQDSIKLVVLNCCHSDIHGQYLSKMIPCVIAMEGQIDDRNSCIFTGLFYKALSNGKSTREAFNLSVQEMALYEHGQSDVPRIIEKTPGAASNSYHDFNIQLKAEFQLTPKGNPKKQKAADGETEMFGFNLSLLNIPPDVKSVIYQLNHKDFKYRCYEIETARKGFLFDELWSYGDIEIRIVIWRTDGQATGITTHLTDALRTNYKNEKKPAYYMHCDKSTKNKFAFIGSRSRLYLYCRILIYSILTEMNQRAYQLHTPIILGLAQSSNVIYVDLEILPKSRINGYREQTKKAKSVAQLLPSLFAILLRKSPCN